MSRMKSRTTMHPGAQFNIYRASLGSQFTQAVLSELLTGYAASSRATTWTSSAVGSMLTSKHCGPENADPVDFLDLHTYDDRALLEKMAARIAEAFETWTHDTVRNSSPRADYRSAAVNAANITRRVTDLFPDITSNHALTMALEAVIMFLVIEHGQDSAVADVQAAIVFAMSRFATLNAQHRGELPNGMPSSPLLGD